MIPIRLGRGPSAPTLLALLLFALLISNGWAKEEKKQKKNDPPTGDLTVEHKMRYPTRVALGADGKIYVTDAHRGSLFILGRQQLDAQLSLPQTPCCVKARGE